MTVFLLAMGLVMLAWGGRASSTFPQPRPRPHVQLPENDPDERVGDVLGDPFGPNLGQTSQALQNYQKAGGLAQGDFNGDGLIDFKDLLILGQNYGHVQGQAEPLAVFEREFAISVRLT